MKTIKCSDFGMDCHFEATGETNEEVKQKAYKHAEEVHAEKLAGMSEEEKQAMDKKMDELLDAQE